MRVTIQQLYVQKEIEHGTKGTSQSLNIPPRCSRLLFKMTTLTQNNVAKFYARLNAFRAGGEFMDANIKCADGESFKCHRLALGTVNDYFKGSFRNSCEERTAENIASGDVNAVNAVNFLEVRRFIYTGDSRIDSDNFWDVFRASKFFCFSNLRDSCTPFVWQNMENLTERNFLDILYSYAHKNDGEDVLANILRPHLADRLERLYKTNEFLQLPSNALREIVNRRLNSSAPTNRDETVAAAIMRSVQLGGKVRSRDDRELFKSALFQNIKLKRKIGMATSQFIFDDYSAPAAFKSTSEPVLGVDGSPSQDLHIYVTFARETIIRIFSIDSFTGECNNTSTVIDGYPDQNFTTIALNNTLYRLLYYGDDGLVPVEEAVPFSAYDTADMRIAIPLKIPPIRFEEVSLCSIQNNIYAYHKSLPIDPIRTTLTSSGLRVFNDQEIMRGIFMYNCELDLWCLVPEMRIRVQRAGITSLDDTLFLIGGYSPESGYRGNFMQAHDSREGRWQMLPATLGNHFETSACCLLGKIYVMGGYEDSGCERYDPVAGRWEWLDDMVHIPEQYAKSIVYQDKIWHFNRGPICQNPDNDGADTRRRLYFQTGRNRQNADSPSPIFKWSSESIDLKKENATKCVDYVFFKKLT